MTIVQLIKEGNPDTPELFGNPYWGIERFNDLLSKRRLTEHLLPHKLNQEDLHKFVEDIDGTTIHIWIGIKFESGE